MENPKVDISSKVHQLKEALCDLKEQDVKIQNQFYLNHWLRTNKFDVHKAEKAIRANVKWRQENNITDALIDEELDPEIADRFPCFFDLKTREGAPFVYAPIGAMDIADLVKRVGKDRLVRHIACINIKMEKVVFDWDNQWKGSLEDLPADRTHGFFSVYDAAGFSIKQAACIQGLQFYLEWARLCLNNFPSVGRKSRVVNASSLIDVPFKLVKAFASTKDCDLACVRKGEKELKDHIFNKIEPRVLEELQGRAKGLQEKMMRNDN